MEDVSVACASKVDGGDGDKKLKDITNNVKVTSLNSMIGGASHNKASTSDGEDHEMSMNDSVIILD